MAVEKRQWDQRKFEELSATWSPQRLRSDEKLLKRIYELARFSPLLAEALDWAETHGMKFFVDHTLVNSRGYYTPGTGVMGLAKRIAENPADAVSTMVHEIRHAWQDYHGFGKDVSHGFVPYYLTQALKEADAKAYGLRAGDQCRAGLLAQENKPVPSELQASLADENRDLGEKFVAWFSKFAKSYGDSSSKFFGQKYDLFPIDETKPDKGLPEMRLEFSPKSVKYPHKNICISCTEDIVKMGANFAGTKNYLAALQPDVLPKKILRPSLADTFWGAANDEQIKLTSNLRKAYLKQKLASKNKKPRCLLP